jgi:hypothetical protein
MKHIPLTKGYFALVDDEDFEWLSKFKWHYHKNSCSDNGYAMATIKQKRVSMHRLILGVIDPLIEVDHRNLIGIDNQRHNLRSCTKAENMRNKGTFKTSASGYKGVNWSANVGKWHVRIMVDKKAIDLGYFDCKESAARVYNNAAKKFFREFAWLNDVPNGPIVFSSVVPKNNTSGYRGVSFYTRKNRYIAAIEHGGKVIRAGSFKCPIEAAKAYDKKALELLGDKAKLNFKNQQNA